jgi:hypothetical protein
MISALESRATVDLGTIGTFQGCFGGVNPVAAYNTTVRDDLQGYVDDLGLARGHAPGSYTVTVSSVSFWNGASWTPAHYVNDTVTDCPDTSANAAAQLVIVTLRAPNTALYSAVVVAGTPT